MTIRAMGPMTAPAIHAFDGESPDEDEPEVAPLFVSAVAADDAAAADESPVDDALEMVLIAAPSEASEDAVPVTTRVASPCKLCSRLRNMV